MKVLVYPHDLQIGGSQINAIDLAAEVAEHGHEAVVYAIDGPLRDGRRRSIAVWPPLGRRRPDSDQDASLRVSFDDQQAQLHPDSCRTSAAFVYSV